MGCTNCNQDPDCGCTQEALHISQVCNPIQCETEQCSESFPAACAVYTGADIICDNVIIVESGENVAQALANIVAYVCSLQTNIPRKFVFEGTLTDPGALLITVPRAEMITCGLLSDSCGADTQSLSDFVINGYRYSVPLESWVKFDHFDKTVISIDVSGNISINPSFIPSPTPEEYPLPYRIVIIG